MARDQGGSGLGVEHLGHPVLSLCPGAAGRLRCAHWCGETRYVLLVLGTG